jgi:hypothetical protein
MFVEDEFQAGLEAGSSSGVVAEVRSEGGLGVNHHR